MDEKPIYKIVRVSYLYRDYEPIKTIIERKSLKSAINVIERESKTAKELFLYECKGDNEREIGSMPYSFSTKRRFHGVCSHLTHPDLIALDNEHLNTW